MRNATLHPTHPHLSMRNATLHPTHPHLSMRNTRVNPCTVQHMTVQPSGKHLENVRWTERSKACELNILGPKACGRSFLSVWRTVQVPQAVARVWRPLCEQAMRSGGAIDEDAAEVELGSICMPPGGGEASLRLTGAACEAGLPAEYRMVKLPLAEGTTVAAISYAAQTGPPEELTGLRVDGTMSRCFTLAPTQSVDKHGQVEIDSAYRAMSRDRNIRASIKTATVQRFESAREDRMAQLEVQRRMFQERRRKEVTKEDKLDNRRLRKERKELEAELFSLFERQSTWQFSQLVRETHQPPPYVKEVLAEIAFQNKRGPNRDLYELKHEYKDPAARPPGGADSGGGNGDA